MPGKLSVTFMNRRRSPYPTKNMETLLHSKDKTPPLVAFKDVFDKDYISTSTSMEMIWKVPTPPLSPGRDELPECEESMDLTQFGKIETAVAAVESELSIKSPSPLDFDIMNSSFNELVDFIGDPTQEIEDFAPVDDDGYPNHPLSLTQAASAPPIHKDDVMIRGDIMWSESSRNPSPRRSRKEDPLYPEFDSALNVSLMSDVVPSLGLCKSKAEELAYKEWTGGLGTETPSDSEEEIDVVSTEESDKQMFLPQISPEEIQVRVTAKRAAAEVAPEVKIEVNANAQCFCPSSSKPHYHNHHVMVDHHNYSLPPTPAQAARRTHTPGSHQSVPEPQAVRRGSVRRGAVDPQVVEQALQQAMQLQAARRTQKGARKNGTKGQKRVKSGRVGKSHSVNTACQYVQVATGPSVQGASAVSLGHSGGKRRTETQDTEEDGDKRNQHNVLERNRRIVLSGKFTSLKLLVPSIMHQEKASKVVILNSAESYIRELRSQETQFVREHRSAKARNEMLKKRLAELTKRS